MDITIHYAVLPHTDPDAALAFSRDSLGFEVRNDVGYEGMRWITVGPAMTCTDGTVKEPDGDREGGPASQMESR